MPPASDRHGKQTPIVLARVSTDSTYSYLSSMQWLFRKLTVAVREGAAKWPSALPTYSSGGVRYENNTACATARATRRAG